MTGQPSGWGSDFIQGARPPTGAGAASRPHAQSSDPFRTALNTYLYLAVCSTEHTGTYSAWEAFRATCYVNLRLELISMVCPNLVLVIVSRAHVYSVTCTSNSSSSCS